jgi:hypothetical protein
MAKIENKPAEAYAQPHGVALAKDITKTGNPTNELNISVGGISKNNNQQAKTSGIKIRGTGAATKGTMARGPMA